MSYYSSSNSDISPAVVIIPIIAGIAFLGVLACCVSAARGKTRRQAYTPRPYQSSYTPQPIRNTNNDLESRLQVLETYGRPSPGGVFVTMTRPTETSEISRPSAAHTSSPTELERRIAALEQGMGHSNQPEFQETLPAYSKKA